MAAVASSSKQMQMEVNPRGIPRAPFVVSCRASENKRVDAIDADVGECGGLRRKRGRCRKRHEDFPRDLGVSRELNDFGPMLS